MTVPVWECKRGDDFYAPQPIVVKVGGVAQDLTDPDWDIQVQCRTTATSGEVAFTPTWDTDTALLEAGELWLIFDRADTEGKVGTYSLDVQATNDTLPKVKRKSSQTWTVTFVADVTQDAP